MNILVICVSGNRPNEKNKKFNAYIMQYSMRYFEFCLINDKVKRRAYLFREYFATGLITKSHGVRPPFVNAILYFHGYLPIYWEIHFHPNLVTTIAAEEKDSNFHAGK